MRKLDPSGNHHRHTKNIKEAGMNKAQEKRIVLARFFSDDVMHAIDPSTLMVSTTGSDGRFENKAHPGVRSNLELQVVTTVDHTPENVELLISRMRDLVGFTIENIEHKRMGVDSLSLYRNSPDLVFPTRFFDSVPFFDPSGIRSRLLRGVSEEIIAEGRLSSKMYDRFRAHRKMMETGEDKFRGQDYTSYDLDAGTFHYDPENFVFGVKNGPLRYVQYMLAVGLMRYIRDSKSHPGFMDELPTSIVDRLMYIRNNSLSTKNETELKELQGIYEFFLHLYHEMQYRHFSEGETDFIVEDRDILKDIRDMLSCLRDGYKIEQFYPVKVPGGSK